MARGAGISFAPLKLIAWQGRRFHITSGRVLATLMLLFTLPAEVLGNGIPLNAAILYLVLLIETPDSWLILRVCLGFGLATLVLYPLACAVLKGLPLPLRLPGLLLLPFGAWCFLLIAGGHI